MTENEEFYKLTFSQREGRASLPEPMRLEHVSEDFRNLVWLAVDNAIEQERPWMGILILVAMRGVLPCISLSLTMLSRFFIGPTTI